MIYISDFEKLVISLNQSFSEVAVNLVKLEYIILHTHLTPIHLSIQVIKNSVTAHIL